MHRKAYLWTSWQELTCYTPNPMSWMYLFPCEKPFHRNFGTGSASDLKVQGLSLCPLRRHLLANQIKHLDNPRKLAETIWPYYNYCHLRKIKFVWLQSVSTPTAQAADGGVPTSICQGLKVLALRNRSRFKYCLHLSLTGDLGYVTEVSFSIIILTEL